MEEGLPYSFVLKLNKFKAAGRERKLKFMSDLTFMRLSLHPKAKIPKAPKAQRGFSALGVEAGGLASLIREGGAYCNPFKSPAFGQVFFFPVAYESAYAVSTRQKRKIPLCLRQRGI